MSAPSTAHPTPAFFKHFDRHANGKGLKGSTTHYCPGCGHGLIHKYLAECIAELGIQDRTVAISPVGCAVFLYYYLDVGNTQAAHGRAPAVALGHKTANPEAIVVSYQGDGDLASIGLAEIMHAAQLGLPISVVFVNNAIYGMTGGQMAPTTLPGQISSTTPEGRGAFQGPPLKVAEMIAGLDGPLYVERTALFDQKSRNRTKRAIRKILQLQMEGKGFGLVEVLSECPTHLRMTPQQAEEWVRDVMTTTYPLGVLKNVDRDAPFRFQPPMYDVERVLPMLEASNEAPERFAKGFPTHLHPDDVALKLAGAGGDGAQTAALVLAKAAIAEGFDATHIPSYGPESRGGTSYADVHVARHEVLSPASERPHALVAFNAPSLVKFGPTVVEGGVVVYDSSVISEVPTLAPRVRAVGVPATEIAVGLGKAVIKNMVALGALRATTAILPSESMLATIRRSLKADCAMLEMNVEAFRAGERASK